MDISILSLDKRKKPEAQHIQEMHPFNLCPLFK